jgi:hypothetical protein
VGWDIFPATAPDRWRARLASLGCDDPYFSAAYHAAYAGDNAQSLMYVHDDADGRLIYPFRLRPIARVGAEAAPAGLHDIETVYGYTGPLADSMVPGFLDRAWQGFADWAQGQGVVSEFCRFHPLLDTRCYAAPAMRVIEDRSTVTVALTGGEDGLWSVYDGAQRNLLRKARRAGLDAEVVPLADSWPVFRTIYEATMQGLAATDFYHFPDDYYRRLAQVQPAPVIAVVRKDGIACAAAIFLAGGDTLHYHLSGSLQEFRQYAPNNLLLHAAALWGMAQGLKTLFLGGGRTNQPDDKLLHFKQQFSRTTVPFHIGRRIWNEAAYADLSQRWSRQSGRPAPAQLQHYRLPVSDPR